jgi:hypothetical protein
MQGCLNIKLNLRPTKDIVCGLFLYGIMESDLFEKVIFVNMHRKSTI